MKFFITTTTNHNSDNSSSNTKDDKDKSNKIKKKKKSHHHHHHHHFFNDAESELESLLWRTRSQQAARNFQKGIGPNGKPTYVTSSQIVLLFTMGIIWFGTLAGIAILTWFIFREIGIA